MIRKHIESTILHEISHILPTSDEFAKEMDEEEEDEEEVERELESPKEGRISDSGPNPHNTRRKPDRADQYGGQDQPIQNQPAPGRNLRGGRGGGKR